MNPKSLPCLMAMLFISTLSFAQNCTYDVNEVDEFTKQQKIFSSYQTLYFVNSMSESIALSFRIAQVDSFYTLVTSYQTSTKRQASTSYCYNDNTQLMIKTASDSVVTLLHTGVECAEVKSIVGDYGSLTTYTVYGYYSISREQFNYLSTQKINKIRIYFTESYRDIEIQPSIKKPFGAAVFKGEKEYKAADYFQIIRKCFK